MLTDLERYYTPAGSQLTMTGEDWFSERDKKAQARAEAARKKAALALAKKLEATADALNVFRQACNECRDGSGDEARGAADGRNILMRDMMEYAGWLESRYGK